MIRRIGPFASGGYSELTGSPEEGGDICSFGRKNPTFGGISKETDACPFEKVVLG